MKNQTKTQKMISKPSIQVGLSVIFLLALIVQPGCAAYQIPHPKPATVFVILDLGGGSSGFAATLYAQEVTTGKTVHLFQSAGSHGLVVLPTSEPIKFQLDAPGTYIFYATLINNPDDYHYGATGCATGQDCASSELVALEVAAGGVYHITITDRHALLPTPGEPVRVPWHK
jgi:hypothetical protein